MKRPRVVQGTCHGRSADVQLAGWVAMRRARHARVASALRAGGRGGRARGDVDPAAARSTRGRGSRVQALFKSLIRRARGPEAEHAVEPPAATSSSKQGMCWSTPRSCCCASVYPGSSPPERRSPTGGEQWPATSMVSSCPFRGRTSPRTSAWRARPARSGATTARSSTGVHRRRREEGQVHVVPAQREAQEGRGRVVLVDRLQVARSTATA